MIFTRIDDFAEESDCKRYTIAATKSLGHWHFEAWRRSTAMKRAFMIERFKGKKSAAAKARMACQLHAAAAAKGST